MAFSKCSQNVFDKDVDGAIFAAISLNTLCVAAAFDCYKKLFELKASKGQKIGYGCAST